MDRWTRLGRLIRAERVHLGYRTLGAFAHAAGVSRGTISNLERGTRDRYQPETVAAVEAVLGWQAGSVVKILGGGKPTREDDADLALILAAWPRLDARARRALRVAAEALRRD